MKDRHDPPNTTLSPLRNILLMKRSLLTGFLPLPLGISVHISLTSADKPSVHSVVLRRGIRALSNTRLLCLSNAFTRASNFRPFRRATRIWLWFFTAVWSTDRGPLFSSVAATVHCQLCCGRRQCGLPTIILQLLHLLLVELRIWDIGVLAAAAQR